MTFDLEHNEQNIEKVKREVKQYLENILDGNYNDITITDSIPGSIIVKITITGNIDAIIIELEIINKKLESKINMITALDEIIINTKNQWRLLKDNFNKGSMIMICINAIISVINKKLITYKRIIKNNISKHINDLQMYYKITPYKKHNVLISNVYKIEIEPVYYNTYSMLCDIVRVAFKRCYDVLGNIILTKKLIENNLKRSLDKDNLSNINFIQGLEYMRRESLKIKRINKKYSKEKNTFTIKIRVILYELTNVIYRILNINMITKFDKKKLNTYSPELNKLLKVIFGEKMDDNKTIEDTIDGYLWNINIRDTEKEYDQNNQIANLKMIYMLKVIYTLSSLKIFIIKNLTIINGKSIIPNDEIYNIMGLNKERIKYLKLKDISDKKLKELTNKLKKMQKPSIFGKSKDIDVEQINILRNNIKEIKDYRVEIMKYLGYDNTMISTMPSDDQWKTFHYISAMTRGDISHITSIGDFDMSSVNSLGGLWILVRIPPLTGGQLSDDIKDIRIKINNIFDGKGGALNSGYILVNILPTMLTRGDKLFFNDMYYITHAEDKVQKKEFHFIKAEKFMKIKTNDNGSAQCTIELGCRYNNILSYSPKMRRCKIINSTIDNMSGYLYTFSESEDVNAINLEYLVNNWHIILRKILCGTLGTKKLDKYFKSNYLYKMNQDRQTKIFEKYNIYNQETGTGNIRIIKNNEWKNKISYWLFSGSQLNV